MRKSAMVFFALMVSAGSLPGAGQGAPDPQGESRTLTLKEAVRLALSRSPEVLLAETQAGRARESIREIRSLNRPQVFTGTGLAYNNGYPLSMEGAAPSIIQLSASQSVFSKKNSNLIREAEETEKASSFGVDSVRNELASKTALIYSQLYQARRLVELASRRLDVMRTQQEQVETLLEAGRVRPVEKTLAQTATQSARQQLLVAEEQMTLAEKELRQLTGLPDTVTIKTSEPQIENPVFSLPAETLYEQALERTPEILQSEAAVRAKEFHVEAEKGERLPKADVIGQYALFSRANNYADYFNRFSRNNFLLGLSFQVPLFDGFRTSSRVAQSKKEVSEARYRVEGLKADLKLTIERCLSSLRIARGAAELAQNETAAARETIRVNQTLLEAAKISPQDMEESRALLQQKEIALLETDQTVFQRKLDLLRAVGAVSSALQ
jgi:outer membrane protein